MANYFVKTHIRDLQDNEHYYRAGDSFPREGLVVSDERLKELVDGGWIEETQEPTDLMKLKKDELLDLAKERGVDATEKDTKTEIINKLGE